MTKKVRRAHSASVPRSVSPSRCRDRSAASVSMAIGSNRRQRDGAGPVAHLSSWWQERAVLGATDALLGSVR